MRFKIRNICYLFLLLFVFTQLSVGQTLFILKDNVQLSFSDDSHLDLLTENPDSLNLSLENPCYPQPYAYTLQCYPITARIHDTSYLIVTFKDIQGTKMGTFVWSKLNPGVYRFAWWENYGFELSGIYFAEATAKDFSKTTKIVYIK